MTKRRRRGKRKQNWQSKQIQTRRNSKNLKHWQGATDHANMLKEKRECCNILTKAKPSYVKHY